MSIVAMSRVSVVGHGAEHDVVLRELQDLGCLQLLPVGGAAQPQPGSVRSPAYAALKFLLSSPQRRRQVQLADAFDAADIEQRALELQRRLQDCEDERDALVQRLADLEPWGQFCFPLIDDMAAQRLWFYEVPHHLMSKLPANGLVWQEVRRDRSLCYLVVVAEQEPADMPVPRVHAGARPRSELVRRLEEVEIEIDEAQAQRASLTRWIMLFTEQLDALEDQEARGRAAHEMLHAEPLFGLEAWVPTERLPELDAYVRKRGLVLKARPPAEHEKPPTLMENPRGLDVGEALVTFYTTPGYRTWDPSPIVLFSFALFFAMILADFGYAMVLGIVLALLWKRLAGSDTGRRFRNLLLLLTSTSALYGVLAGSYFGVAPDPESALGRVSIIDLANAQHMMALSIVIGVSHLVLANVMNARRFRWRWESLAAIGWAGIILGGFLYAFSQRRDLPWLNTSSLAMLSVGALLVLVFTGAGQKPLARVLGGLLALTRVTSAFGDVLSYLRLFALGLASASLAAAFNDMAGQVRGSAAGLGLLFALLILLIGHGLNFVLSLSSAVIHGLRLNVIEFFNWGLTEEGTIFRPFRRKERRKWTP